MNYDVDFFIRKFEAIPSKKIINKHIGSDGVTGCALGWCSANGIPGEQCRDSDEYNALIKLFYQFIDSITYPTNENGWAVADVNNGDNPKYQQPTPKQRILAALRDIKAMQSKEPEVQECDATKVQSKLLPSGTYPDLTKELAVLPIEETVDFKKVINEYEK